MQIHGATIAFFLASFAWKMLFCYLFLSQNIWLIVTKCDRYSGVKIHDIKITAGVHINAFSMREEQFGGHCVCKISANRFCVR